MVEHKKSIHFFNDRGVRALWDDSHNKWWFSVLYIIVAINEQDDYQKTKDYWKYLKTKLKKENNELASATNQLKLQAPDGKQQLTDMLDEEGGAIQKNISQSGFTFANCIHFPEILQTIELMPGTTFDKIMDKNNKMNVPILLWMQIV